MLAVDVLAAEAMKRYMPRHGIERSRHHRQRRNGNATGFRDPHVDKTFAYFESVSYEEGEEIVRFKQPGITAVTKLSSDERSTSIHFECLVPCRFNFPRCIPFSLILHRLQDLLLRLWNKI